MQRLVKMGVTMQTPTSSKQIIAAINHCHPSVTKYFAEKHKPLSISFEAEHFSLGVTYIRKGLDKEIIMSLLALKNDHALQQKIQKLDAEIKQDSEDSETSISLNEKIIALLVEIFFLEYDGLILPGNCANIDPIFFANQNKNNINYADDCQRRTALEIALINRTIRNAIPALGICGGIQTFAVALGGKVNDVKLLHHQINFPDCLKNHPEDTIAFLTDTALRAIIQKEDLNKISIDKQKIVSSDPILHIEYNAHCQAVDSTSLDNKLIKITATNNEGVVKALEMNGHPFFIGTQFHPEENIENISHNQNLFKEFLLSCAIVKEQKNKRKALHQLKLFKPTETYYSVTEPLTKECQFTSSFYLN